MNYCFQCGKAYSEALGHECIMDYPIPGAKGAGPGQVGISAMPTHYSPHGGIPVCWYGLVTTQPNMELPPRNSNPKLVNCLSCLKWLKEHDSMPEAQIQSQEQKASPAPIAEQKVADSAPKAIYQGLTDGQRDKIGQAYYEGYSAYDIKRRNWYLAKVVPWEELDVLIKEDYRKLAEEVIKAFQPCSQPPTKQDAEWKAPKDPSIKPGDVVNVAGRDGQEFRVHQLSITEGGTQYELVWWEGGCRNMAWFMSCEVIPHIDQRGTLGLKK